MKKIKRLLSYLLTAMVIVTAITSTGVVAHATMLPIPEEKAFLLLNGYTDDQLSEFSVDTLLSMLEKEDGEKVIIEETSKMVWKYEKDGETGLEEYIPFQIGNNEKMNILPSESTDVYQMEIIVGSDGPLNTGNKRYIVVVYLNNSFDDVTPYLYLQKEDGSREEIIADHCNQTTNSYPSGRSETNFDYVFGPNYKNGFDEYGTVWLGFDSKIKNNPRVNIKFYWVVVTPEYMYPDYNDDITEQVLNIDMEQSNSGLKISFEKNEDVTLMMATYVDGNLYGERYVCLRNWYWYPVHEGKMLTQNGKDIAFSNMTSHFDAYDRVTNLTFELNEGLSETDSYYFDYDFVRQKNNNKNDKEYWDGLVDKIVIGHYYSLEEAENAGAKVVNREDFLTNGYLNNFSGKGMDFTLFKSYRLSQSVPLAWDDLVDRITVKVVSAPNTWREYTDKPIVGETDPWFNVNGLIDGNGKEYSTSKGNAYVVENGKNINMDTYYGYGYQTVFVKDDSNSSIDLSSVKPIINYANTDRLYAVSKDTGDKIDESHTRDFSESNQQYTLVFDNNTAKTRNYWITYKKLNDNGPELYVLGPNEREVIFDEYFGDKHDILFANVGNESLTNISVELQDAVNVKLDGYWTAGGENNNTLAAFSTTSKTTQYGELPNMGKIRLVKDGDGEVKGTVIIKAGEKGREQEVTISLNGTMKTPEIVTDTLKDAVKYVPYQSIIATDNIHKKPDDPNQIRETFEIVEGELPEGIELRDSGEIYGAPKVPKENKAFEDYEFTVKVSYFLGDSETPFDSKSKKYSLKVKYNTNDNVFNESDDGYAIKQTLGTATENSHEYLLENLEIDHDFISWADYNSDFQGVWLNGEKLDDSEYIAGHGSTKITIKSQTFKNKTKKDDNNTIAIEYRTEDNEVKRTAQNFIVDEQLAKDYAVENVISLINAIPSTVTLDDKAIVQKARTAYNALSPTQKKSVANYSNLTDAESVISKLETDEANKAAANKVVALINSLPNTISISDKTSVESARSAYDDLSPAQKNYVSNYNKLLAAEDAIKTLEKNRAAAKPVISLINDIPTSITLDCKDEVTAARNAYNKLTSEQKEYVTNYKKLQAAEAAIETLETEEQERAKDRAAAQPVIDLINAIPSTVTLESEDAITSARNAYNLLLSNQKGYVTNYQILTEAEDKLAELKKETDGKTVNMVCYVVDKNGKALVDYLVEIHSDIQQSRTDENGFARFSNVKMGNHTLTIKNVDGTRCAEKTFKITEGNLLSLNNDEIIAEAGSTFTLAVKVDNENISFLSVKSGDQAPELKNDDDKEHSIDISDSTKDEKNIDDIKIDISDSANGGTSANTSSGSVATGDRNTMYAWYVLLVCSWTTLVVMFVHNRRKRNR